MTMTKEARRETAKWKNHTNRLGRCGMAIEAKRGYGIALMITLSACAVKDAQIADRAERRLLGISEVDLQSCIGAPDQHSSFGRTDVLTYYATSQSSTSFSLPLVGGMGFSNGAYCHATFRVDNGRVTRILYSGEKNATGAPNAYCAPIVRTCLTYLDAHPNAGRSP